MYQVYQDVKYISPMVDDYGVDDVLNPMEEPFAASFTRLMEVRSLEFKDLTFVHRFNSSQVEMLYKFIWLVVVHS